VVGVLVDTEGLTMVAHYASITAMKAKPSYWEDEKYYEKRNKDLLKDRAGGMSLSGLMRKYDLSLGRVQYIVKRSKNE
jgi:hypothetical protein